MSLAQHLLLAAATVAPPAASFATKQPPAGPLQLAAANPLTDGIFFAATPTNTSMSPTVDANAGTVNALDAASQTCIGWCNRINPDGDRGGLHFNIARVDSQDWTLAMFATISYVTAYGAHPFVDFYGDGGNRQGPCAVIYGKGGNWGPDLRPNGGDIDAGGRIEVKSTCDLFILRISASTGKMYASTNGRKSVVNIGTNATYARRINLFGKGNEDGSERGDIRIVMPLVVGWTRVISDAEEAAFISNPWQIYPG